MGLMCLFLLLICINIYPLNENKIFFNASAIDDFEDIKENVAIALYDFDADILELEPKEYFPEGYKSFIRFKKDDFLQVHDEFDEDFWWAESLITQAKGIVPSFLVKYLKDESKNHSMDTTEISIIRAMQDFDSMNLTGYLSYKKEDTFKIIKPMDSLGTLMLLVESEETGRKGIVTRKKTYLFNATALYDFDAEILKVQSIYGKTAKFNKGDTFYVIQNIKDIEFDGWMVKALLSGDPGESLVLLLALSSSIVSIGVVCA